MKNGIFEVTLKFKPSPIYLRKLGKNFVHRNFFFLFFFWIIFRVWGLIMDFDLIFPESSSRESFWWLLMNRNCAVRSLLNLRTYEPFLMLLVILIWLDILHSCLLRLTISILILETRLRHLIYILNRGLLRGSHSSLLSWSVRNWSLLVNSRSWSSIFSLIWIFVFEKSCLWIFWLRVFTIIIFRPLVTWGYQTEMSASSNSWIPWILSLHLHVGPSA